MTRVPTLHALLPAAGSGARMQSAQPKQYLQLGGRTLLEWSVAAMRADARIADVLVVVAPDDAQAGRLDLGARVRVARAGGSTRAATVRNGLRVLQESGAADDEWVLVHDAARCCLAADELAALIDAVLADGDTAPGGLLALPLSDTVKRDDGREHVAGTVDRSGLWRAATPQMFRLGVLARAFDAAGDAVTDESSAIEALGLHPRLVAGRATNIKLTTPDDLPLATAILRAQRRID